MKRAFYWQIELIENIWVIEAFGNSGSGIPSDWDRELEPPEQYVYICHIGFIRGNFVRIVFQPIDNGAAAYGIRTPNRHHYLLFCLIIEKPASVFNMLLRVWMTAGLPI